MQGTKHGIVQYHPLTRALQLKSLNSLGLFSAKKIGKYCQGLPKGSLNPAFATTAGIVIGSLVTTSCLGVPTCPGAKSINTMFYLIKHGPNIVSAIAEPYLHSYEVSILQPPEALTVYSLNVGLHQEGPAQQHLDASA